jgi:hypothetical protein
MMSAKCPASRNLGAVVLCELGRRRIQNQPTGWNECWRSPGASFCPCLLLLQRRFNLLHFFYRHSLSVLLTSPSCCLCAETLVVLDLEPFTPDVPTCRSNSFHGFSLRGSCLSRHCHFLLCLVVALVGYFLVGPVFVGSFGCSSCPISICLYASRWIRQ